MIKDVYTCISVLFILIAVCCNNHTKTGKVQTTEDPYLTDDSLIVLSNDKPESKDSIYLTDIADSLFYISLKGGNLEVLQLHYLDSLILVSDIRNVYIFHANGEVRSKLPLYNGSFDVSSDGQKLYTYTFLTKELCAYDLNGNHIWKTKVKYSPSLPELGYYGYSFLAVNDTTFAIANINFGNNRDKIVFVNQNGKVVHRIANDERFTPPPSVYSVNRTWQRILFRSNGTLCYHAPYSDTLYAIHGHTLNLSPTVVEEKLAKVPLKKRLEYTGEKVEDLHRYCTNMYTCPIGYYDIWTDSSKYITRFFETSRYLIVGYTHGSLMLPTSNFLIYDKKKKVLSRTHNDLQKSVGKKRLHFGIFNDYDGGLAFEPEHLSGEYLIMVNAGESQGGAKNHPKELYLKGRKVAENQYTMVSDVYRKAEYKKRADDFFNKEIGDEDKHTVLTIIKVKSK